MFKSCVVNSKIGANRKGAAFSIFFYFRGRNQGNQNASFFSKSFVLISWND